MRARSMALPIALMAARSRRIIGSFGSSGSRVPEMLSAACRTRRIHGLNRSENIRRLVRMGCIHFIISALAGVVISCTQGLTNVA